MKKLMQTWHKHATILKNLMWTHCNIKNDDASIIKIFLKSDSNTMQNKKQNMPKKWPRDAKSMQHLALNEKLVQHLTHASACQYGWCKHNVNVMQSLVPPISSLNASQNNKKMEKINYHATQIVTPQPCIVVVATG